MNKKSVSILLSLSLFIGLFVSCSTTEKIVEDTKNTIDKGADMTQNALDKAKEMITGDTAEGEKIEIYTDDEKVSDYNLENFKANMDEKGYTIEIFAKDKDFFDAPKFEVKIGENKISVYDYEDMNTLEKDLSAITENGLVVSDAKIDWDKMPHYYRKGEMLVIYDGDNTETINALENELGPELYK